MAPEGWLSNGRLQWSRWRCGKYLRVSRGVDRRSFRRETIEQKLLQRICPFYGERLATDCIVELWILAAAAERALRD